jgi:hypothetical protein
MTKCSLVCQLTWRRHGTGWRLFVGRRRFGDVVPDSRYPGMWRSPKSSGRMSGVANLSWAKNAVFEEAIRELEWKGRHRPAISPSKSQQIGRVFESRSSPMRFSVSGVST